VEYNQTAYPRLELTFEQFKISDKWCDIVTTLEVEKKDESDSTYSIVPYGDHDGVYITLSVSP